MKPCYIISSSSISAQETFEQVPFLQNVHPLENNISKARYPKFADYISRGALRRMAIGSKMGVLTAQMALEKAALTNPDAIITGTGMGCIEHSEKFLSALHENEEQFLTPTSFIQSTHNTVGAQIALSLKCNGYNVTYTHGSNSFESALVDTQLTLHEGAQTVLTGAIDELGTEFIQNTHYKNKALSFSEGAHFFVMSARKNSTSYAKLTAISCEQTITLNNFETYTKAFLAKHQLSVATIDAVILGSFEGDENAYVTKMTNSLFPHNLQLNYKHLCGQFDTASAFGFWAGTEILRTQNIPKALIAKGRVSGAIKTLLIYNQHNGKNHSFIVLQSC